MNGEDFGGSRSGRPQEFVHSPAQAGRRPFRRLPSEIDILTYLYFEEMNIRPEEPDWPKRDRFVLSKGHGGLASTACWPREGFFRRSGCGPYENGVMLPKHVDRHRVPGVDVSTGSLGQGLSSPAVMALAAKRDGSGVWFLLCWETVSATRVDMGSGHVRRQISWTISLRRWTPTACSLTAGART